MDIPGNGKGEKKQNGQGGTPLPKIDFSTFVLSLFTTARYQMGEIANPYTGESATDLPMAKETIDILGMLEEKTRGNLSKEEKNLLENLLYTLRMTYVTKRTEK